MDDDLFQKEARRHINMLTAAISTGRCIAYNGHLHGTEVIVIGYRHDVGDGKLNARPLAIAMTDEVFDLLDVQAEKVKQGDTDEL